MKKTFKLLFIVFTFSFLLFNLAAPVAMAQIKLAPDCNPTLSPVPTPEQLKEAKNAGKSTQPCDIVAFITWIKSLINTLLIIVIPIGVIFIIYGAFVIMTAGGSEDKAKKGKDIITAAAIGVAISFGAWLLVTTVKQILGVLK